MSTIPDNPYDLDPSKNGNVIIWVINTNAGVSLETVTADQFAGLAGFTGLTNYVPSAGLGGHITNGAAAPINAWYAAREGVYVTETVNTIPGITDGTSNTIAFGEFVGGLGPNGGGNHELAMAWMGSTGFPSYFSMPTPMTKLRFPMAAGTQVWSISRFAMDLCTLLLPDFSSPGSVAGILGRTNSSWDALQSLAGKNEGDVIQNGVLF